MLQWQQDWHHSWAGAVYRCLSAKGMQVALQHQKDTGTLAHIRACAAGSERVGKTLADPNSKVGKEGSAINSSLLVLERIFMALANSKAQHVPYRECTLTRALQVRKLTALCHAREVQSSSGRSDICKYAIRGSS